MRVILFSLILMVSGLFQGCQSMAVSQIGMTEKEWLRRTLIGDLASDDGTERVWKSNGAFYHFKEGRLVRVSQGVHEHVVTVR